jgi:hypothetical protein
LHLINLCVQAAAASGTSTGTTLPFRRLLGSSRRHTSDRDLEDRSAAVTNPTLAAAVKRLEVSAAAAGWLVSWALHADNACSTVLI